MTSCEFSRCLILGDTWEAYADVDRGKSNLVNKSFLLVYNGFPLELDKTFDLQRVVIISAL